ncbi:MAG: phosphatase PAP2 family protein [Acholeplasmataceae bacterium]
MDLDITKIIQLTRNPVLDWVFYILTQLGDQYTFIVIAVILYWVYDKKYAHRFAFTFMLSALVNTGIKEIFKRPRPYIAHPDEVSVEPHWETDGYSFPSGHAQASGVLGYTAYDLSKRMKKPFIWKIGLALMILVPLSRIYLGQHYLSDVVVGVLFSFFIAHYTFKLIDLMKDKEEIYTLIIVPFFMIGLIFVQNHTFFISAGAFIGFAIGYFLEKRYVKYDVSNKASIQIIKVICGLIGAILIKEGLKFVFADTLWFDFLRYFLIGVWVAYGAPLVFKYVFRRH